MPPARKFPGNQRAAAPTADDVQWGKLIDALEDQLSLEQRLERATDDQTRWEEIACTIEKSRKDLNAALDAFVQRPPSVSHAPGDIELTHQERHALRRIKAVTEDLIEKHTHRAASYDFDVNIRTVIETFSSVFNVSRVTQERTEQLWQPERFQVLDPEQQGYDPLYLPPALSREEMALKLEDVPELPGLSPVATRFHIPPQLEYMEE